MTTVLTKPTYPAPNREIAVVFTKSNATADYIRVWVTEAPVGSDLRKTLEENGISRHKVHEGDSPSTWRFNFDRGGCYRLVTQEYTRGATTHGGAYEDDPDAAPTETKVGSENSLALYIGQRMVCQLGVGEDTADLVLHVVDSTIRKTTLADHGEISPRIENPSTPRATAASAAAALATDMAALVDVSVSSAIGDIATVISNVQIKFDAHLTQASVHQNNDADNALGNPYGQTITPKTFPDAVSKILGSIRRHFLNDNGYGPGSAGTDPPAEDYTAAPYHDVSGEVFDFTNMPLFESVGSTAEAYRALADCYRAYEAHRVSTAVHDAADATNTLTALPSLLEVHKEFFTQLAAISPTVPNTQSTGAMLLMAQTGAVES